MRAAQIRNYRLRRQVETLQAELLRAKRVPKGTRQFVGDLAKMIDEHARAIGALWLADQVVGMEYLPHHDSTPGSPEQARVKVALHAIGGVLKLYRKRAP